MALRRFRRAATPAVAAAAPTATAAATIAVRYRFFFLPLAVTRAVAFFPARFAAFPADFRMLAIDVSLAEGCVRESARLRQAPYRNKVTIRPEGNLTRHSSPVRGTGALWKHPCRRRP